ncbi:MAG: hypothetical protein IKV03_04385 [Alphaproteobacteria bacterium]|nr:hypothetical protein [Alphaproteobacteria bacterium]
MRKNIFYSLLLLGFLSAGPVEAFRGQLVRGHIQPSKMLLTQSVQNLNLESPFRCNVKEYGDIEVMTTLSLSPNDFTLRQADIGDALPRFEVNGFSFATMPIDKALALLVKDANINIASVDRSYPELNADELYGELEPVIAELTRVGDVFYRYDDTSKRLTVSKRGQFELQLPHNRTVVFAVLDALRGAGIKTAVPNWKDFSIMLTLSRSEEDTVNTLMSSIVKDGKLLVADTQVYLLNPIMSANWQDVVNRFGPGRVYTATNGMVGKMLTMGHKNKADELLAKLRPNYDAKLLSEGIAIVPHGWKMRFDVGRCAVDPSSVSSVSVMLNTHIKNPQEVETIVSVNTDKGEISTFKGWTEIDEELALIGIPGTVAGFGQNNELLITLKLRFIRLLSEGK